MLGFFLPTINPELLFDDELDDEELDEDVLEEVLLAELEELLELVEPFGVESDSLTQAISATTDNTVINTLIMDQHSSITNRVKLRRF